MRTALATLTIVVALAVGAPSPGAAADRANFEAFQRRAGDGPGANPL